MQNSTSRTVVAGVLIAVLSPIVLTTFGVMWQNVTDGALVTLLGGVREERIQEIVSDRVAEETAREMLQELLVSWLPDKVVMVFDDNCPDEQNWEELARNSERGVAYCRTKTEPADVFDNR